MLSTQNEYKKFRIKCYPNAPAPASLDPYVQRMTHIDYLTTTDYSVYNMEDTEEVAILKKKIRQTQSVVYRQKRDQMVTELTQCYEQIVAYKTTMNPLKSCQQERDESVIELTQCNKQFPECFLKFYCTFLYKLYNFMIYYIKCIVIMLMYCYIVYSIAIK